MWVDECQKTRWSWLGNFEEVCCMNWNHFIDLFVIVTQTSLRRPFSLLWYVRISYVLINYTHPPLTWKTNKHYLNFCWIMFKIVACIRCHTIWHENIHSITQWKKNQGLNHKLSSPPFFHKFIPTHVLCFKWKWL
jgi:hypothetical protein